MHFKRDHFKRDHELWGIAAYLNETGSCYEVHLANSWYIAVQMKTQSYLIFTILVSWTFGNDQSSEDK